MYCQVGWNDHSKIKNKMAKNVSGTCKVVVLYTLYYEVWGNGYENKIPPLYVTEKKNK